MSLLDLTGFDDAFKELYPDGLAENLYEACPLYGWMNKDASFGSDVKIITPFIGGVRGSNTFDVAKQNKSTITTKKFQVTRVRTYALASLDRETMLASQSDKYALASALETTTRGALYEMEKAFGHQIYSNQGGWRFKGDGTWTVSSTTMKAEDATDLHHIEIGDRLVAASTDGTSGSLRPYTDAVEVTGIDPEANTITVDAAPNGAGKIPTIANTDYWFREGDFGNCMAGVRSWIPFTLPAGTFFNVDRSTHRVRLAGVPYTGGGKRMEKSVHKLASKLKRYGANGGEYALFCHPEKEAELLAGLHSKTYIDVNTDIPSIMYEAATIATALGKVPIISDPYCPYDFGFLLKRDTWRVCHLGEHPHFVTDNGGKLIVEPSNDGVEFRIAAYHNVICDAPGHNGVLQW